MSEGLHGYNFGEMTINLPRHWVPISELDQIAEEFSEKRGMENNYDTLKILKEKNIDVKDGKADFNGVNFYLLQLGLINREFLSGIMEHNFSESYTNIEHLSSYLKILQRQIGGEILNNEEKEVISALEKLVS